MTIACKLYQDQNDFELWIDQKIEEALEQYGANHRGFWALKQVAHGLREEGPTVVAYVLERFEDGIMSEVR